MKDILERIEESSHNESSHELLCRLHDCADEIQRLRAANAMQTPFQARVQPWMLECFGAEIAADSKERNHRFFEEAGELVQARGMTREEAHALVDYTWSRPIGESFQEVGGVMVTLAALCLAAGLDMHAASETELARITEPATMERIRAKQAAKPKHSPLPEHMDPPAECGVVPWQSVIEAIYAVDTESARRGEMYPQTADEQQEDRRAVKRVTEMIRWYATNGGAGIERFKGWPNLPPTSSPVALQEGRGAFEIWFKTEWNRYLDKPTLSEVKAKTWALKAWKAFAQPEERGRAWVAPDIDDDLKATEGPLLELDVLLANLHQDVWESANHSLCAYDEAGKDEAKAIQKLVRSMLAAERVRSTASQAVALTDDQLRGLYNLAWLVRPVKDFIEEARAIFRASGPVQGMTEGRAEQLQTEIDRLNAIINTPQYGDFLRAVSTEAEHQRQRWGSENDAGKEPEDWFWLIGYLAGKAVRAAREGNREKYEHHIITAAAALKNWHAQLFGQSDMRPGIQPPTGVGITRTNSPAQGATEEDPRPRDCSGDPESCPDNEGCGCWCSDRANSKESGQ